MSQIKGLLYVAGEWLLGVTDLPSHPALCGSDDDSSFRFSRSKEDTCSVVEPFVGRGVPNTPLTHMSLWFTTPHQFLLEILTSMFLLLPVLIGIMKIRASLRKTPLKSQDSHLRHKLAGVGFLLVLALQAYYKTLGKSDDRVGQHWAYLAQPCHVLTLLFGCSYFDFIGPQWGVIMRHFFIVLSWGPMLALGVPDLPAEMHLIVLFFLQHIMLIVAVPVCIAYGPSWMLRNFWFNWTPFFLLLAYHYWFIAPLAIMSGANVGTMTHPPVVITFAGRWYRLVAAGTCVGIHCTWVIICQIIQALIRFWRSNIQKYSSTHKHSNGDWVGKVPCSNTNKVE